MEFLDKRIGLIGAGNMGEAIAGALLRARVSKPANIVFSDIDAARLKALSDTFGVAAYTDNRKLFSDCDVVILAVKPQQTASVLEGIAGSILSGRKLFISIAAGTRIHRIEEKLYAPLGPDERQRLPIIRVMPNTPAMVLAGMSGISANRYTRDEDLMVARKILTAMGRVLECPEEALDGVTALSGSGPAYVFFLAEAMIAAGIELGFTREEAGVLTLQTIKGAVSLMEDRGEDPAELRKKVTSPGGTTEAALQVLEAGGVKGRIIEAIGAAANRSRELSG